MAFSFDKNKNEEEKQWRRKNVNDCKLQANKKKTIVFIFSLLNCPINQKKSPLHLI